MTTGKKEYKRVIYTFDKCNKDNTARYYQINNNSTDEVFTQKLKIEKDNGFHDRSRFFEYWLYFRNDTNWQRCRKSGLSNTSIKNVFLGDVSELMILNKKTNKGSDWQYPKQLLIVQFSKDINTIVIDCFKDFYTNKRDLVNVIIKEHELHFKPKI